MNTQNLPNASVDVQPMDSMSTEGMSDVLFSCPEWLDELLDF